MKIVRIIIAAVIGVAIMSGCTVQYTGTAMKAPDPIAVTQEDTVLPDPAPVADAPTDACTSLYATSDAAVDAQDTLVIDWYNALAHVWNNGRVTDDTATEMQNVGSESDKAEKAWTLATTFIGPCGNDMDPTFRTVSVGTSDAGINAIDALKKATDAADTYGYKSDRFHTELKIAEKFCKSWQGAITDYYAMRDKMGH